MKNIVTTISTQGYKIIESGTFLLPAKNSPVKISIDNVCINISFTYDERDPGLKDQIQINNINDTELEIICKNWSDSPFGIGITQPIAIMEIEYEGVKEVVYFKFLVFSLNDMPHIIYTFYTKMQSN